MAGCSSIPFLDNLDINNKMFENVEHSILVKEELLGWHG